jgi:hypothetical protein
MPNQNINYFKSKYPRSNEKIIKYLMRDARRSFHTIEKKSKRSAYIKSKYFKGEKVFFTYYWDHLKQKINQNDRRRRLQLFDASIDLITNSTFKPTTSRNHPDLFRFFGITSNGISFAVQIKRKTAISISCPVCHIK